MNNYEHIVQGGVEALISEAYKAGGFRCEWCAFREDNDRCSSETCKLGIRTWLLQEYVDPDSWDRLLGELDSGFINVTTARSTYNPEIAHALASRIRKLMGGE